MVYIVLFILSIIVIGYTIKLYIDNERKQYKLDYPELNQLKLLRSTPNYSNRKETLLLAQHYKRCTNIEAIRGNIKGAECFDKLSKKEIKKL